MLVVIAGGAFAAYRFIPGKPVDPPPAPAVNAPSAVQESTDLLHKGKDTYRTAFGEADADKRRELMNQALKELYRAYKLNRAEPEPLKWMGNCNQNLGNIQDAVDNFTQYVKAEPPPPDVEGIRKTLALLDDELPKQ